jgi:hypothetical protein
MPAEKNECGDVPAHDEDADRKSHDAGACSIHFAKIFRRQKKGISAITIHKPATDCAEQKKPKEQQHLESFKM